METKFCFQCKKDKFLDEFSLKKKSRQPYCRECNKKYQKEHYRKNKLKYYNWNKKSRIEDAKKWNEYKSTLSCIKCGFNHPAVIDFHHRDMTKKENSIAMARKSFSKKKLLKEIEKCDILCANCHRIVHYEAEYGIIK